jgi:hypothetical protein
VFLELTTADNTTQSVPLRLLSMASTVTNRISWHMCLHNDFVQQCHAPPLQPTLLRVGCTLPVHHQTCQRPPAAPPCAETATHRSLQQDSMWSTASGSYSTKKSPEEYHCIEAWSTHIPSTPLSSTYSHPDTPQSRSSCAACRAPCLLPSAVCGARQAASARHAADTTASRTSQTCLQCIQRRLIEARPLASIRPRARHQTGSCAVGIAEAVLGTCTFMAPGVLRGA